MPKRGASEGEAPERLHPLQGGRHGLPADVVAFNQRERLLAAMAATAAEFGYNKTTIGEIADTAKVSRRTFYEHFSSKEACFLAAYDAVDDYIATLLAGVSAGQENWSDLVAAAFAALMEFLAGRPQLARLYLVEAAVVGEGMSSRRAKSAKRLIVLLETGRAERSADRGPAEGIEEALVGGILTLTARRILAGEAEQLQRFVPAIVEFALAPYLGVKEARRISAHCALATSPVAEPG